MEICQICAVVVKPEAGKSPEVRFVICEKCREGFA